MIIPSKHFMLRDSLLWLWSIIIQILNTPKKIDEMWKEFEKSNSSNDVYVSFDDFMLTLHFLYIIWLIECKNNKINLCN